MTSMRHLLAIMLVIVALSVQAASWSVYPYADQYRRTCYMGQQLYLLKGNNIYIADAEQWQIKQLLSREEGLSGSDINDIVYSPDANRLAVIYNDGLIDVRHPDGSIWTITDFYASPMAGFSKAIRNVREQQGWLYISTDFGFVVVDLYNEVIRHTINLQKPANCAWSFNGDWYYSDNSGSYYCPKQSNPYNPQCWQPSCNHAITQVIVLQAKGREQCWQVGKDQSLRKIDYSSRTSVRCSGASTTRSIQQMGQYVIVLGKDSLSLYDTNYGSCPSTSREPALGQRFVCHPNKAYLSAATICPIDSLQLAFVHTAEGIESDSLSLSGYSFQIHPIQDQLLSVPNHQQSDKINRLVEGPQGEIGMTYIVPPLKGYSTQINSRGFLTTVNSKTGSWSNYTDTIVANHITDGSRSRFVGLIDFVADPKHAQRYWYSTIEDGITGIDHGTFYTRYYKDNTNGGLDNFQTTYTRVAGLTFSPKGDLWCINDGVTKILRVRQQSNGKWYAFQLTGLEKSYGFNHIIHTQHGGRHQVWACQDFKYQNSSVFCYDYGTSIQNSDDDRYVSFLTHRPVDGPPFVPYYGRGLYEGPDGTIWLYNTSGLFAIDQPDSVFTHPGQMRTVLSNLIPTAVVADNQNHLWVSTEQNGLYLLTTDGREQLDHITAENSMLPTNEILSIAYDHTQGTLWIATEGQLLSYTYDAKQYGGDAPDWTSTAWCHPGVAAAGSHPTIQVFGVTDDAEVTVQNAQGRVVANAKTWGNHATIDAGNLPHGSYSVFGTDDQGHEGLIASFRIE